MTERFADGLAAQDALKVAWERSFVASRHWGAERLAVGAAGERGRVAHVRESATSAACYASHPKANTQLSHYSGARGAAESAAFAAGLNTSETAWVAERAIERAKNAILLREIVGNPFREVVFSPDWRTDTVLALAQQMYESREFSAMPILADALQDAGYDNEDILDHCRSDDTHVRGCWVVDLVLGKE
jgi:hypothetical protein